MPFRRDNPYGILIIALPFVIGGSIMLSKTEPGIVRASALRMPNSFYEGEVSVPMEHAAGVFGLVVGGALIYIYIRAR